MTISYLLEWLLLKKKIITSIEDVEKKEFLCTIGGYVN